MALQFQLVAGEYAVCRLAATEPVPAWAQLSSDAEFLSVTRTSEELSIVAPAAAVQQGVECARGWRVIKLVGPFPLEAVGVLAPVLHALAREQVNVFVVSTYNTDWILVPDTKVEKAVAALRGAGCELVA